MKLIFHVFQCSFQVPDCVLQAGCFAMSLLQVRFVLVVNVSQFHNFSIAGRDRVSAFRGLTLQVVDLAFQVYDTIAENLSARTGAPSSTTVWNYQKLGQCDMP